MAANPKKTVVLIYDSAGVVRYQDGDFRYTRSDMQGDFGFTLGDTPIKLVDSFRYLGVHFNKQGDFQATADTVFRASIGNMLWVPAKIRSLLVVPIGFALVLYRAIVKGSLAWL